MTNRKELESLIAKARGSKALVAAVEEREREGERALAAWAVIRENLMSCKSGGEVHHSLIFAVDKAFTQSEVASVGLDKDWEARLYSDFDSPMTHKDVAAFVRSMMRSHTASDLLSALESIKRDAEYGSVRDALFQDIFDKASAAIKKAKGQE